MTKGRSAIEPIQLPTVRTKRFDPAPELGWLRDHEPVRRLVFPDVHIGWLVTNHALAKAVLTDSRFSMRVSRPFPADDPKKHAALLRVLQQNRMFSSFFIHTDPPEHTRFRRLLAGQFSVRGVEAHRAQIEEIVTERLDAIEQVGPPVDFVKMFAAPISLFTSCALLGIPQSGSDLLERPSKAYADPHATADDVQAAYAQLGEYVRGILQQRRANPEDDIVSHVLASGELTDDEILGIVFFLFTAGHDATTRQLALGMFALLCHPEQLEALRADSSLIETAVEELLRYLTILQAGAFTRTAREDVELDGVLVKAGEPISVSLAAANRDPQKFDHPDSIDVTRNPTGHLAFGQGVHMCIGQHLARLEMQIALGGMISRFPKLQLAVAIDEVPLERGDLIMYGVHELPVTW